MAKLSRLVLELSRTIRWCLLFYSHFLFYILFSSVKLSNSLNVLFIWIFAQYQLSIFLIGSIRPDEKLTTNHQCPICNLHFSDRFHHCFFVNRCVARCNVHCFLSFTFYATFSTLLCFCLFLNEFFYEKSISSMCLFPFGEFFCRNINWSEAALVLITRSTLISAGCAGAMGFHVAKEFYFDRTKFSRRSIFVELIKILLPAFSVIRND